MEKITSITGKFKQKGIFNFKDYYAFTYDWFIKEGYKLVETLYLEEITGDSKKVEIEWKITKNISDYFQFAITARWMILGLKNTEIQREGQKIKLNSGQVEIKLKSVLIKDYQSKWETPFFKWARKIYDEYIIKDKAEKYEDKIKQETEEFIEQAKAYLVIEGRRFQT